MPRASRDIHTGNTLGSPPGSRAHKSILDISNIGFRPRRKQINPASAFSPRRLLLRRIPTAGVSPLTLPPRGSLRRATSNLHACASRVNIHTRRDEPTEFSGPSPRRPAGGGRMYRCAAHKVSVNKSCRVLVYLNAFDAGRRRAAAAGAPRVLSPRFCLT